MKMNILLDSEAMNLYESMVNDGLSELVALNVIFDQTSDIEIEEETDFVFSDTEEGTAEITLDSEGIVNHDNS